MAQLPAILPAPPAPPPLVWANGAPIDMASVREQLTQDVAGPRMMSTRSVYSGHPSQGLTPGRLAALLIEAEQGDMIAYLELAEEIEEKEWQYGSVLGTRKRAVAQSPITVEAADDSAEAKADAEFIRAWLRRDTLQMELFDILDAVGKGFSITEIVWRFDASQWTPERLMRRDPRWFRFDPVDGETLLLNTENGPEPLSAFKYIQHVHPNKTGLPVRGGLARPMAWAWMFKNFTMKEWLAFVEVFGMPLRVGRYDNGESEENIRRLMGAIAQIGQDAAAVFPKSMEVEFIDGGKMGGGTGDGALFRTKAEYLDQQISKIVLGQTATTDAIAGGHAVGKVHNEVRKDIRVADEAMLAATLNRDLVRPMIILNRGQRKAYPRLKIGLPDEVDVKAMAAALQILVPLGLKVSAQVVRQRAGFPDPLPGEEVLVSAATLGEPAPPNPGDGTEVPETASARLLAPLKPSYEARRAARAEGPRDALDDTTDEALDDWLPMIAPVVAPIRAAAADAATLEEFRGKLLSALGSMDVTAFAELLARGTFASRIVGMAAPTTEV